MQAGALSISQLDVRLIPMQRDKLWQSTTLLELVQFLQFASQQADCMTFLLCTSHSYIAESRPFPECLSEMTLWMQVAPTLVSVFATSARSLVGASIQSSAFWIHPFRFAKNGALRRQIKLHCFWSQGIHTHIHALPLRASPSSREVLDNVFSRPCRLDKSRVCQVCRIGELISFKCGRGMPCSGSYWVKTFGSRGPSSVAEQKQQRLITLILAPVGEYYVILGSEASDFGFLSFTQRTRSSLRSDALCLPRNGALCSVSGFPFSQSFYTVRN